jgi:hypothetical protein
VILRSFAEIEGETTAARQSEQAQEGESKAGKGNQLLALNGLSSDVQRWHSKVIIDDTTENFAPANEPFS